MAAPNFRPSGSCAQFSCILYGLGAALGSAPCAYSRSHAIPDSALTAAAIITCARSAGLIVALHCAFPPRIAFTIAPAAIRRCPQADTCAAAKRRAWVGLFDHLVGAAEQRERESDAERLGSL